MKLPMKKATKSQASHKLGSPEERYEMLFNSMLNGFALHEIICDESGKPINYRFLEVNPAFEKMTGLKASEIIGKTVLDVLPSVEKFWIETYGEVALTGKPTQFEHYSTSLDKFFEVNAFSPTKNQFATLFLDITERKKTLEKLNEALGETKKMLDVMTGRELKMFEQKNRIQNLEKKIIDLGGEIPKE